MARLVASALKAYVQEANFTDSEELQGFLQDYFGDGDPCDSDSGV